MYSHKIKKIVREILYMGILLFLLSNIVSYIRKPNLDSNLLPEQTFELIDGTHYTPIKGKPLLIHFWATWCPVCSMEAQNIQSVSKAYEVISIATQSGSNKDITAHMHKEGIDFRVVNDIDGSVAEAFHVTAFPTDFIYGADDKLYDTQVGYSTTAGLLTRLKFSE